MWYNDARKGFGLAIKIWRGRFNISQEELAWRAGLHRTYVADIERGARNPSLLSIEKIARALKISFSTLFEPMKNPVSSENDPVHPGALVEILLVESCAADAEAVVRAFEKANVRNAIRLVRDSAEAIECLWPSKRADNPLLQRRPRLILLSLDAPKIDGLELLRRLKADSQTRNIPVIIFAGDRDQRACQEARRLGFETFMPKPIDLTAFHDLLLQLDYRWGLLADVDSSREKPPKPT